MKNILRQASEKNLWKQGIPDQSGQDDLLVEPAEGAVHSKATQLAAEVENLRAQHQYGRALEQIARLRPHVDLLFDKVMVMVDDPDLRFNRLALIAGVVSSFSSIADFSEIVTS